MAKDATRVRRRERKNITSGVAHVNSSFNNTMITITDAQGNTISWSSSGLMGFKGSRKSTPYAAQMAAEDAGKKATEHGVRDAGGRGVRPRFRPRVGAPGLAVVGVHHHIDPRRDPDRPQRLPSAQAPPRLAGPGDLFSVLRPVAAALPAARRSPRPSGEPERKDRGS